MRVREKGAKDGEHVHLGWDEAQAALQAGTHEVAEGGGTDGVIRGARPGDDEPEAAPVLDLDAMTRAELDKRAIERGLDPSKYGTKADVIAALKTA